MTPSEFLPANAFVRDRAAMGRRWSLEESLAYTKWVATGHYENFHVVSFLLPKALHQDFYNVYAFCRWADDLGDEIGDPAESLRLLAWWREEFAAMEQGEARHPVMVALAPTINRRELPRQPFLDLVTAFEQDQTKTRYENWEELQAYCRYSANPVGRLVLALCGYQDEDRAELSDATCTGLQLANFWQDVTVDTGKNRIYLPQELLRRHGVTEEQIFARQFTPGFRQVMEEAVTVARSYFVKGLSLPSMLDRRLALDITLFSQGGLQILQKIEEQGYDVLKHRPKIGKVERVALLGRTLLRVMLGRAA